MLKTICRLEKDFYASHLYKYLYNTVRTSYLKQTSVIALKQFSGTLKIRDKKTSIRLHATLLDNEITYFKLTC